MGKHPFRPLRHRSVRLIWGASVVSDIGTWVQLVVVGSLVARSSGSALQTGLVALATFMPQGLAAPVGGLLADKFDRRRIFIGSLLAQGVATALLAVLLASGVRDARTLAAVILLSASAGFIGGPSYAAMLPDLVPADELMPMVSLGIYAWNSGRIVGPILGTLLNHAVGPAWTVAFNAATFILMALAVSRVRRPFIPSGLSGSIRQRLGDGARGLRAAPGCIHGFALAVILGLWMAPFMGLIPIYVTSSFGGGTGKVGALSTVQGIGAILCSALFAVLASRIGQARLIPLLFGVGFVSYLLFAFAPNYPVLLIAVFFLGGTTASLFIMATTLIQRDAPDDVRGRVLSLAHAANGFSYGLGILQLGVIADTVAIRAAFVYAAVAMLAGFWALTRRSVHWRAAIDGTWRQADRQLAAA